MTKITVDIEYIKDQLNKIGYEISDCIQRENNGLNWQLKFNNSGASVTIFDSNKVKNTVVNGKADEKEKKRLKQIIDDIKAKEFVVDPLNEEIISLIRSHKEDYYYDFKRQFHKKDEDLLYDIICLSNNLENRDAYLIIGVADDFEVIGIDENCKSNNIYDFMKSKKFAGDFKPEIEIKNIYLEQQVSALYKSWFEDFEITNSVCPENWSYQELSTIADITSGKRPPIKSNICNEETPIYLVGAASVMGFTSEVNHTDKILVTGRVGTHGVIQRFNTPCWTSDNTLVITSPYYEFTNQILHRIDYSSMNRGSTQPLITQGDMKKVVVLVPDEHTLAKFEEFAGSLMAKWEANNKENIKLASLRDTLLPKLMSGELDVSDIDI